MKTKSFILFLILCMVSLASTAQTGCIIVFGVNNADNRVYTSMAGGSTTCNSQSVTKYSSSNSTPLNPGCVWYPNPAAAPATLRNCIVGSSCGVRATYVQLCPIDTNTLFLVIATGLVGLFAIHKRQFFLQ